MSLPRGDRAPRPSAPDVQATRAAVLADEWARAGVRRAVVCPGGRSGPLALALARQPEIAVDVRLDERSAGFYALGAAAESGRPVIVCTTSGTAAAELHPAVVEAHHGRVPLVVVTADRPPELHDVGAPQTIDQAGLFAGALRFAVDLGPADWDGRASWRSLASRVVAEAFQGPFGPGPVHVNVPLREPLTGALAEMPPGRPDGAPWHRVTGAMGDGDVDAAGWARRLAGRRGVVLAGAGAGDPGAPGALAEALGWPLVADPLSGWRRVPGVVGAADAIARSDAAGRLRPEVVVRLGAPWASREVASWLEGPGGVGAGGGPALVVVDPWWRWSDPGRSAAAVVRAAPGPWCRAVAGACAGPGIPAPPTPWRGVWQAADAAAWRAIGGWCRDEEGISEPGLARAAAAAVPEDGALVVSSSMPVRDVEWFVEPHGSFPRTIANRGANGIDGVISTALGAAAGGTPVVALVGDLAFLHDLGALVRPEGWRADCTVVVADNGGGGIFSFLPQASALGTDEFEALFATPQAVDVAAAAAGLGVPVDDPGDMDAVGGALKGAVLAGGLRVVRVRVPDRATNVEVHDAIHRRASAAVESAVRDAFGPDS